MNISEILKKIITFILISFLFGQNFYVFATEDTGINFQNLYLDRSENFKNDDIYKMVFGGVNDKFSQNNINVNKDNIIPLVKNENNTNGVGLYNYLFDSNKMVSGKYSSQGAIALNVPGNGNYSPYSPGEFQVNIPIGEEDLSNGNFTTYNKGKDVCLNLPTISFSEGNKNVVFSLYGLGANGEDLLGFDVYNTLKNKNIIEKKGNDKKLNINNYFSGGINNFESYINNKNLINNGFIGDNGEVLGVNNFRNDTNNDGIKGNGYFKGNTIQDRFGIIGDGKGFSWGDYKDSSDYSSLIGTINEELNKDIENIYGPMVLEKNGLELIKKSSENTNNNILTYLSYYYDSVIDKNKNGTRNGLHLNNVRDLLLKGKINIKNNEIYLKGSNFSNTGTYENTGDYSYKVNYVALKVSNIGKDEFGNDYKSKDIQILDYTDGIKTTSEDSLDSKIMQEYAFVFNNILDGEELLSLSQTKFNELKEKSFKDFPFFSYYNNKIRRQENGKSYDIVLMPIIVLNGNKFANDKNYIDTFKVRGNIIFDESIDFKDFLEKIKNKGYSDFTEEFNKYYYGIDNGNIIDVDSGLDDGLKYNWVLSGSMNTSLDYLRNKKISQNPNIFPIEYVFNEDSFLPTNNGAKINIDTKLPKICFSDDYGNSGLGVSPSKLFDLTPISKSYYSIKNGKKVYYKTFIGQIRQEGDMSFGDDIGNFLGKISAGLEIYYNPFLTLFSGNNNNNGDVIKDSNWNNWDGLEKPNLTISSRINSLGLGLYRNGDVANSNIDFLSKAGNKYVKFNEFDGDSKNVDKNSVPKNENYSVFIKEKSKGLDNSLVKLSLDELGELKNDSSGYTNGSYLDKIQNINGENSNNITIQESPTCIEGYQLYRNYQDFYKKLYDQKNTILKRIQDGRPLITALNKLFDNHNLGGNQYSYNSLNINYTTYFNTIKPFCINKKWSNSGNVNDLGIEDLMSMLRYYVEGIQEDDINNFSNNVNKIFIENFLKEYSYESKTLTSNSDKVYINPINKIFFTSYKDVNEYFPIFANFMLYSFSKLFITEKNIPEQFSLKSNNSNWKDIKNDGDLFKYFNLENSSGTGENLYIENSKINLDNDPFALNLLDENMNIYFPIIGAYKTLSSNKILNNTIIDGNTKLCNNDEYYLDGNCVSILNGNIRTKGIENSIGIKKDVVHKFTKVSRLVGSENGGLNPIPIISGTSYYINCDDKAHNFFFNSIKECNSFNSNNNIKNEINYGGKNISGNIYSFKRSINPGNLGLYINNKIDYNSLTGEGILKEGSNLEYVLDNNFQYDVNKLQIDLRGLLTNIGSINDDSNINKLKENFLMIPKYFLENTNDVDGEEIGRRLVNENLENIYNKSYVQEEWEKSNGEEGIIVDLQPNISNEKDFNGVNEDKITGIKYYDKSILENEIPSKKYEIVYDGPFNSNAVYILLQNQNISPICFNDKYNNGVDSIGCVKEYDEGNEISKIRFISDANIDEEKKKDDLEKVEEEEEDDKTIDNNIFDYFTNDQYEYFDNTNIDKNNKIIKDLKYSKITKDIIGTNLGVVSSDKNKVLKLYSNGTGTILKGLDGKEKVLKGEDGILSKKNIEPINNGIFNDWSILNNIYPSYDINGNPIEKSFTNVEKIDNSTKYVNAYNNDSIILSNGNINNFNLQNLGKINYYGGYNKIVGSKGEKYIDTTFGNINQNYIYNDNDSLTGEGISNNYINEDINGNIINTYNNELLYNLDGENEILRKQRRDRIKDAIVNEEQSYLNLLKIKKEDFYSLNGILRISKDPRKYFANLKIQDPNDQTKLLIDKPLNKTIYSYNNLVISYGNKNYTWGDNDTNCNGINPNTVYNKIDKYSNINKSREDTMTICLGDKGLSGKNPLSNDIYIKLPIKPSKSIFKLKNGLYDEVDYKYIDDFWNFSNNGYAGTRISGNYPNLFSSNKDNSIVNESDYKKLKNSYYQGGYIWDGNNQDFVSNIPIKDTINNGFLGYKINVKDFRKVESCCGCDSSYITNYIGIGVESNLGNLKMINNNIINYFNVIPKLYINGFIIKGDSSKTSVNRINMEGFFKLHNNDFKINGNIVNSNLNHRYLSSVYSPCEGDNRTRYSSYNNTYNNVLGSFFTQNEYYSNDSRSYSYNRKDINKYNSLINSFSVRNFKDNYYISNNINNALEKIDIKDLVKNKFNFLEFINIKEYNINDYKNNIDFTTQVLDGYKQYGSNKNTGNFTNNAGNYIEKSLKENDYKISINDRLSFLTKINVKPNIPINQNFYFSTNINRGLDLSEDSLKIVKKTIENGIEKEYVFTPTYNQVNFLNKKLTTKDYLGSINNDYVSNNTPEVYLVNKKLDISGLKNGSLINLKNKDNLVVTKGVLYLRSKGDYDLVSNNILRFFNEDSKQLYELPTNGLYEQESNSDVLDRSIYSSLKDKIIILKAGEELSNVGNVDASFEIISFGNIPSSFYSFYNKETLNGNFIGLDLIDSGKSKGNNNGSSGVYVTPRYSQPYYLFKKTNGNCVEDIINGNPQKSFYNNYFIKKGDYCGIQNKYIGEVFDGYLNFKSSYSKLALPSIEFPFSYGNSDNLGIFKLQDNKKYFGTIRNGKLENDSEKELILNLGFVKENDIINIYYEGIVNNKNDINHKLFNFNKEKSNGGINEFSLVKNDTLLDGNFYNDNTNIYKNSKNTKLFYITHYGKEEIIKDQPVLIENGIDTNKLQVVPKTNINIINLSGRNKYDVCNPIKKVNTSNWNCEVFNDIATFNSTKGINSTIDSSIGEANIPIYKGQKIGVRVSLNNLFDGENVDKKNNISEGNLNLLYNSNFLIFDNIVYENVKNGNNYLDIINENDSPGLKQNIFSKNINNGSSLFNKMSSSKRLDFDGRTKNINGTNIDKISDYKQINYKIESIEDFNNKKDIVLDFVFTIKNTTNIENLNDVFENAFLQNITGLVFTNFDYKVVNNNEKYFENIEGDNYLNKINQIGELRNPNYDYLKLNNNSYIDNNSNGGYNFLYYNIPFSKNYELLNNKKITDFNIEKGYLNIRYFMDNENISNNVETNVNDNFNGGLTIEINNTSDKVLELGGKIRTVIPHGFNVLDKNGGSLGINDNKFAKIDLYYNESDNFNTKLIKLDKFQNNGLNNFGNIELKEELDKKVLNIFVETNGDKLKINPGKKIIFYVYLGFDKNNIDLYSSFSSEVNCSVSGNTFSLFDDYIISMKKNNIVQKTLPLFSDNDVYIGNSYIKNNLDDEDYVNKNLTGTGYYVLGSDESKLNYKNKNVKDNLNLKGSQKVLLNLSSILENKNNDLDNVSYYLKKNDNNISSDLGDKFLISESNLNNFNNNTTYYFDKDVYIGGVNTGTGNYSLNFNNINNKFEKGGITILSKGKVYININIKNNVNGNVTTKNIPSLGIIGLKGIFINPKVSIVDAFLFTPIENKTILSNDGLNEYGGYIHSGYSNNELEINGGVVGGNVINGREISNGNDTSNISNNLVEKYTFNNLFYLNPPPLFRK